MLTPQILLHSKHSIPHNSNIARLTCLSEHHPPWTSISPSPQQPSHLILPHGRSPVLFQMSDLQEETQGPVHYISPAWRNWGGLLCPSARGSPRKAGDGVLVGGCHRPLCVPWLRVPRSPWREQGGERHWAPWSWSDQCWLQCTLQQDLLCWTCLSTQLCNFRCPRLLSLIVPSVNSHDIFLLIPLPALMLARTPWNRYIGKRDTRSNASFLWGWVCTCQLSFVCFLTRA